LSLQNLTQQQSNIRRPATFLASVFQVFLSLLWGGNHVSIKVSLEYAPPMQVGWLRFVLGGFLTLSYMVFKRESFKISKTEAKPIFFIGLLFTVQIIFMNMGQFYTTAGHATALNATYPIWAAIIANFVVPNDRLTRWKIAAIVFSYLGILVLVLKDSSDAIAGVSVRGDVLSLISAALLGFRLVLMSNFAQKMSEIKIMYGQLIMGTILLLIASQLFENPVWSMKMGFFLALAYQGFVIAGFGFLANAWLLKKFLPSTITFFSFVQPPAGVLFAWMVLNEDPGSGLLVGLLLIVVGALVFGGEAYFNSMKERSQKGSLKE